MKKNIRRSNQRNILINKTRLAFFFSNEQVKDDYSKEKQSNITWLQELGQRKRWPFGEALMTSS